MLWIFWQVILDSFGSLNYFSKIIFWRKTYCIGKWGLWCRDIDGFFIGLCLAGKLPTCPWLNQLFSLLLSIFFLIAICLLTVYLPQSFQKVIKVALLSSFEYFFFKERRLKFILKLCSWSWISHTFKLFGLQPSPVTSKKWPKWAWRRSSCLY